MVTLHRISKGRRGALRTNYIVVALSSAILTWSISLFLHTCNLSPDPTLYLPLIPESFLSFNNEPARFLRVDSEKVPEIQQQCELCREWETFPHPFPCYRGSTRLTEVKPAHQGILFQRPTKVGSTTMVGIVLRLVHNRSPWLEQEDITCKHRAIHGSAISYEYGQRDRRRSFLFSLVRDPTKRAISEFFHFGVSANALVPTDDQFKAYLRMPKMLNYYLADLTTRQYTNGKSEEMMEGLFYKLRGMGAEDYDRILEEGASEESSLLERDWEEFVQFGPDVNHTAIVKDILDDYDFIAVTERMDESLVVLQMLLGLETREILYTRARTSGTFSVGAGDRPCTYIFPSFVSPGMSSFFRSSEWKRTIQGDQLLYDAVNDSLDRTIDSLGRPLFMEKLGEFRRVLQKAQDHCLGRVQHLCGEDGKRHEKTSCYIWGEGCDFECLNDFML